MDCLAKTIELPPSSWWVTCPVCQFRGQVPGSYLRRRVRCRHCDVRFRVVPETAVPGVVQFVSSPSPGDTSEAPCFSGSSLWEAGAAAMPRWPH